MSIPIKPFAGSAPLAWLAALGALVAAAWPHLFGTAVPLPGLRAVSAPAVGWPLAAASLAMAVFLSLPRLLTRDRLLVCAGVALSLFALIVFYVSPAAAMLYAFIGANLLRELPPRAA